MDIRLSSIKDHQGKISLNGTSQLAVRDYERTGSDIELGKSSTEFENGDEEESPHHGDRVELLYDSTSTSTSLPIQPHESQQAQQEILPAQREQQRWWQSATYDNVNVMATTRKTKLVTQIKQIKRQICQLDRRQLMEYAIKWRWVLVFFGLSFVMGVIMWTWRKEFLDALESLSNAVRDMGGSGYLLIAFLIFLSAFPPMIGYGTFQTLSGFTFGFAKGFPISYFSALFGAVACFMLSRRWLKKRVQYTMAKYPNLEAVVKAVERKGFKLFVLIRLSPYPFNLLNVLFASTEIPLSHFAVGTALSLLKIALHVYIGANLTSFAKHVLGEEDGLSEGEKQAETVREIAVLIGSVLATGVMIYVYFVAKRAVEEVQQNDEEAMAFLGDGQVVTDVAAPYDGNQIAMEDTGVADDWIDWNETDDDEDEDSIRHSGKLM